MNMGEMTQHQKDYADAQTYQRMAADPNYTRLASANAGSGKTRVLVSRVSRLLLEGADPGKILCLTYTKAAASEMQTRLFETLGRWSVMSADALNAELDELLGERRDRDRAELGKARRLFARALETPEGLKVQTIHAFCERVLTRFPIEAGILPGFEPMEDADALALRLEVEDYIFHLASADLDGKLASAIERLARDKADLTLDGLFRWMAGQAEAIKAWEVAGGVAGLAERLGLSSDATVMSQYEAVWDEKIKARIRPAAMNLKASGNQNDVSKAEIVLNALIDPDIVAGFDAYASILLTQKGDIRSGAVTKSAPQAAQDFFGVRNADTPLEAQRVYAAVQAISAAHCLELTRAVYNIATIYGAQYECMKRRRRWLDFNDQIMLVRDLLTNSEASDWVRYKLDGGIGHILVDEAQDTAPDQWDIIDSLKDGFALPDPDWPKDKVKTFFAVGDEKQSIYSFQGAQPEVFVKKIRDHVSGGDRDVINMRMSFRSCAQVLDVVDAVFIDQGGMERMFNLDPQSEGPFQVRHTAFRTDAGQVDIWPLAPPPEDAPEEVPWELPVDVLPQSSSKERLAVEIANQIKQWIKEGEPVFDRELETLSGQKGATRGMQAGDILILVRRRDAFFDAIIRNLKQAGIAVAGADRLVLKDAIVVKDLLALTRFALLPSDDLSLAEVLKSPLFGFSEDQLFEVAFGRGDLSLWDALQAHDENHAVGSVEILRAVIASSLRFAPYEFYARVLDMTGPEGRVMRQRIYGRLGVEAEDVLDAFLARALAHQRKGAPSLQHFLQSFITDDQDIKREMDSASGEVRVMTVHGAKGLEAPVVILPDTTRTPTSKSVGMFGLGDGSYAYLPSKGDTPEKLTPIRDALEARTIEEYMRLLYVAMTRAESRLVVCGYHSGHKKGTGFSTGSWYEEVSQAMDALEIRVLETRLGEGRYFGAGARAAGDSVRSDRDDDVRFPDWIATRAAKETSGPQRLTPSHLLAPSSGQDMPVRSPLTQTVKRFRRGNLIHKLLEILPDIEPARREASAKAFLDSHVDLTDTQKQDILNEVFAVLTHPEFAPIFAPGSRAEISLAGRAETLPEGMYLNAQIDRLAVTDREVFIVDYKSNRPPPLVQDEVPDIYLGQMAAYRELARAIYPDHAVKCALLWTDGPRLMILDEARLDAALTLIASVPTYGHVYESHQE